VELITALDGDDAQEKVRLLVRESRLSGITASEACFRSGAGTTALEQALNQLLSRGELVQALKEPRKLLAREAFSELEEHLLVALNAYLVANPLREGMGKEELKGCLPKRSDPRFFGALLAALAREGKLLVERDLVRPVTETAPSGLARGGVRDAVEAAIRLGGIEPPTVRELAEKLAAPEKSLLEHLAVLAREGRAVKVASDLYYAPEPLSALRDRLTEFLKERGEITPSGFRELSGLSRKFMIPVLEHFDSVKVTIRVGDVRRLRRG
jgi:selenocysteine-specific elongation factor